MIRKYFAIRNYLVKINQFRKCVKAVALKRQRFIATELRPIFYYSRINQNSTFSDLYNTEFSIFGIQVNLENINWHKDLAVDSCFPNKFFTHIKARDFFNNGTDIKFPWELSRFYFGPLLAKKYLITKDHKYYELFRRTVIDFITYNPFLYGVNWISPMEVSIRSVNWLLSVNLFGKTFNEDSSFQILLSKSLLQNAEYIYSFPEIYSGKHTTNHTTSNYMALLFLGLSLHNLSRSNLWVRTAIRGLEECIRYQINPDGTDFEASTAYHRLVLEMFGYSAIIAAHHNIHLSKLYYERLFRMFEYTASYIDSAGNAPQLGDNDSGRIFVLNNNYDDELNHSYLLNLGNHIFDHNFGGSARLNNNLSLILPEINKISISSLNLSPRDTKRSVAFPNGRAYLLKNSRLNLFVSCFHIGQKGKGGHNHLDAGSFTLSLNGKQLIVDPGTFSYTRNKSVRDKYREYTYHNTLFTDSDFDINWDNNSYWSLNEYYKCNVDRFTEKEISIVVSFIKDQQLRYRTFSLKDDHIIIIDKYQGSFHSRINLHPEVNILNVHENEIITSNAIFSFSGIHDYEIRDYEYSPHYGKAIPAKSIIVSSEYSSSIVVRSVH